MPLRENGTRSQWTIPKHGRTVDEASTIRPANPPFVRQSGWLPRLLHVLGAGAILHAPDFAQQSVGSWVVLFQLGTHKGVEIICGKK